MSIYRWIRSFGKDLEELKSSAQIQQVEIDEMHLYKFKKKLLDLDCYLDLKENSLGLLWAQER